MYFLFLYTCQVIDLTHTSLLKKVVTVALEYGIFIVLQKQILRVQKK